MELSKVNIKDIHPWEKNPKIIRDEKFLQLKRTLLEEGQDLPIIVDSRKGNEGCIISGNMRYKALSELVEEGKWEADNIWVYYKETKNDAHLFKLAVQHNMQYGDYVSEQVLMLANLYHNDLDLAELDIHLSPPVDLGFHLDNFGPGTEDNEPEDPENTSEEIDLEDKTKNLNHVCPKCGFEFE